MKKRYLVDEIREALKKRSIPYIYNPYYFQFIIMGGGFNLEFRVYGKNVIPLTRSNDEKIKKLLKLLKIDGYVLQ